MTEEIKKGKDFFFKTPTMDPICIGGKGENFSTF